MHNYVPLYLANSIQGLVELALRSMNDLKKVKKLDVLCRSADTLYKNIYNDPLDEEKTFILLYKFIWLYEYMMHMQQDTNFVELRFGKEARKCGVDLNRIENRLVDRYNNAAKKAEKIEEGREEKEKEAEGKDTKDSQDEMGGPIFPDMAVTSQDVIKAFQSGKKLLVVDIRKESDYVESHIKDIENINVPENLISSGVIKLKIEEGDTEDRLINRLLIHGSFFWCQELVCTYRTYEASYVEVYYFKGHFTQVTTPLENLLVSVIEIFKEKLNVTLYKLLLWLLIEKGLVSQIALIKLFLCDEDERQQSDDLRSYRLSAHKLGLALPVPFVKKWEKRDYYDVVVLMDWDTTIDNFHLSKLNKLRVIMTEWDLKHYKEKPVFLNGGYVDFLETYPTQCTNANVIFNRTNIHLDELLFIDEVEYQIEEDKAATTLVSEISPPSPKSDTTPPSTEPPLPGKGEGEVILENELKVSKEKQQKLIELIEKEQEWRSAFENLMKRQNYQMKRQLEATIIKKQSEINDLKASINELSRTKTDLAKQYAACTEKGTGDSAKYLKQLQDIDKKDLVYLHTIGKMALAREDLFEKFNPRKKPEVKVAPKIDRTSKPQLTSGDTRIRGLIGMANIRNSCYINTAMQCFRHVPQIEELFRTSGDILKPTRVPDLLFTATKNLLKQLSGYGPSSIVPQEFHNTIVSFGTHYGAGEHEDSMQFFMFYMSILIEDFAKEISVTQAMTNFDKDYINARGGKQSIFSDLFFYQLKTVQKCSSCSCCMAKSETEMVFMLSLDTQRYTLQALFRNYFSTELIQDFICKVCKGQVYLMKELHKEPPILVIMLKRYKQEKNNENDNRVIKINAHVSFPLDNFVVGKSVYKLYGIVLHTGSIYEGHYTAACRNLQNDQFYEFNDDRVSPMDINAYEIQSRAFGFFYSKK